MLCEIAFRDYSDSPTVTLVQPSVVGLRKLMNPRIKLSAARAWSRQSLHLLTPRSSGILCTFGWGGGYLDSIATSCELELSTNIASHDRDRRDAINGNYFNSVAVTVECAMFDFQLIAERLIKREIAIKLKNKR